MTEALKFKYANSGENTNHYSGDETGFCEERVNRKTFCIIHKNLKTSLKELQCVHTTLMERVAEAALRRVA